MKRFFTKKKENRAEGRRRQTWKRAEERKKSKFCIPFFKKPGTFSLTCSMASPAPAIQVCQNPKVDQVHMRHKPTKKRSQINPSTMRRVRLPGGEDDGGMMLS